MGISQYKCMAYLCSQRLGEDQNIANNGRVGDDELVGLADSGGNTTNSAPGVHNGLAASDGGASLQGTILKRKIQINSKLAIVIPSIYV